MKRQILFAVRLLTDFADRIWAYVNAVDANLLQYSAQNFIGKDDIAKILLIKAAIDF